MLVLIGAVVLYFYSPIVFHPNSYLFNDTGDSYKNYYTFLWHAQNDNSIINYTGSNYPFGENHLYTDGVPLLSNVIYLLPFLKPYSVGIFNYSMILAIFFCGYLLYKIVNFFNITKWQAVLSAFGITMLCPQILRLDGHFGLSYAFCIPLIIYLILKYNSTQVNLKQSSIIAIIILAYFFIHPYIGMICASFVLCYWLIKICFEPNRRVVNSSFAFLQAVGPLIAYYLILKLTDHHTDRTEKPYGFYYFIASFETIFISTHQPFRHFLSLLYKIKSQNGEGVAYVGITSLIVILSLPFILFVKKWNTIKQNLNTNLLLKTQLWLFVSAILLLIFAMGYPFKLGFTKVLDVIPLIQQFRSPGRFAWPFYFIVSISSCVFICKYFLIKANEVLRNWVICSLLLLYTIEGIPYYNSISKTTFPKNVFVAKYLNAEQKQIIKAIKNINAQAIIPLPYYHTGTDYYNVPGVIDVTNNSFLFSLHTKLPQMSNLTPRNSITEAKQLIQLFGSNYVDKKINKALFNEKQIVLIYNKYKLDSYSEALLSKGKQLLETNHFIVKTISIDQLMINNSLQEFEVFEKNKSSLFKQEGFYLSKKGCFTFFNFNTQKNKNLQLCVNNCNQIIRLKTENLQLGKSYSISFWYESLDKYDLNNQINLYELNSNNEKVNLYEGNINSQTTLLNGKSFVDLTFKVNNLNTEIILELQGNTDRFTLFNIDDLMFKDQDINCYRLQKSTVFNDSCLNFNNIEMLPKKHLIKH